MARPKSLMERELWEGFRALIAQGRELYGVTIADMCDVLPRKPTALDLYGERVGIQKKARNRILAAGYNTKTKLHKLIENALSRPTTDWKAHAILFMLCNCRETLAWRQSHPRDQDSWISQFFDYLKLLPPHVGFDPPPRSNAKPVAFIHPGGAQAVADDLVASLVRGKLIKKVDADAASRLVASKLRRDAEEYTTALVNWVRSSNMFMDVSVREGKRREPEGVDIHVKQVLITPRHALDAPRGLIDGERAPEHYEYVQGIAYFALENWQKDGPRRPLVLEEILAPAFSMEVQSEQ